MFCKNCGKELPDNSVFCPYCGSKIEDSNNMDNNNYVENNTNNSSNNNMVKSYNSAFIVSAILIGISFAFEVLYLIIIIVGISFATTASNSTVNTPAAIGLIVFFALFVFIPLIWIIPMMHKLRKAIKQNIKLSLAFKICFLLFVNLIGGILLLTAIEE